MGIHLPSITDIFRTLAWWLECSPMVQETWVQSQVESYQRLKKWYLMPPCLTLSIIRYRSKVKWSNPRKGVAPSPTLWFSSYQKGSLWVTIDYSHQLYLLTFCPHLSLKNIPNHYTATSKFDSWYHVLWWVGFTIFPPHRISIIMIKQLNFSFILP